MRKWILMPWLIISILTSNILAGENAAKLKLGDLAPFDGIIVKAPRMEKLIDSERKVPLLEAKISLQENLVEFHRDEAGKARRKLSGERWEGNLKLIGGFLLGVVVTGFAFKVNQRISEF